MKIRAAVLEETGRAPPYSVSRPLLVGEIELAPPQHGEVLVRIAASGLCHSDLSVINGDRPRPLPMVLGHEASGVVEALGPGVDDLKRGDHVVAVFVPNCGHCLPCNEGRPALCEPGALSNLNGSLLGGGRRLSRSDHPLHHHLGVSCFADHAVMSRNSLIKIDPEIDLVDAALFGCAVITGVGAVVNAAAVTAGSTVAVVGLGGVGLAAVLGALAAGAERVIAVDLSSEKLAIARSLGATDCFNASASDLLGNIRELTKGGVDYAIEAAGSSAAMDLCFDVARRGGTVVTVGLPNPASRLQMPHARLTAEEKIVKGSYLGSCVPLRDIPRFIGLFKRGRLPVHKLLSGTLPLDQINAGFDQLRTGEAVRMVVTF